MNISVYLSRRRTEIMGLAAILVVCFHARLKTSFMPWDFIFTTHGYLGVDIFVFLAGFGLAHSLRKNQDLAGFFKRRLTRILPPYYVTMILTLIILVIGMCLGEAFELVEWIKLNLIPLGCWSGAEGSYWYIAGTLVYYALTPLFYFMIDRARCPRIAMILLLLLTGLVIPSVYNVPTADVAIMRIPMLVFGIGIGIFQHKHTSAKDRNLDLLMVVLSCLAGVFLFVRSDILAAFGLKETQIYRLYNNLNIPLIVVIFAYVFEGLGRTPLRFINSLLVRVGKYSLEIYLGHMFIRDLAGNVFGFGKYVTVAAMMILSYPAAVGLARMSDGLLWLMRKLPLAARPEENLKT